MQHGGTEALVRALLQGLSPYYDIVLVSGDRKRADLPAEFSELISSHLTWTPGPQSAAPARELAAALKAEGVELAHFHFSGTFVWGSNRYWRCPIYHLGASGVPCLSTNHMATPWLDCGIRLDRPRWQQHLYQLFAIFSRSVVYRRLKVEVCVSEHNRARVLRMFPHFRRKIVVRYHSLLSAEAPPPAPQPREPLLLCVGTIGGRKGQVVLAEAFARIAQRHPKWRLDLVGRTSVPEDAERIRALAASAGLSERLRLPGPMAYPDALAQMKRASVFVLPSFDEGLPLVLEEALFHGCVAVASRVGGVPELIDDGVNGLLVPPGDVAALGDALDRLMSNPALLGKLGSQSRPSVIAKGMTAKAMLENYQELYKSILAAQ